MNGISKAVRLAGWYGIGEQEASASMLVCREGVMLRVSIPGPGVMELGAYDEELVPWAEIPTEQDAEEFLRPRLTALVRRVCGV